ncbi:MAG: Bax inhibitor-1/YccA family protein [Bacteroidia bacterium]|nr:Bax inhibitor-1/YccA family protein [Bacteroidia bacterium]MDW8158505.1 Bax inhibitor-1/YccA family protein [Bacteroidia bacterium]
MNNYYGNNNRWAGSYNGPIMTTRSANAFLQRVFFVMAAGLAITGLTAYGAASYLFSNPELLSTLFGSPLRWVIMLAPLAFVLILSFGINRLSYGAATLVYALYAIVMGISLSSIFFVYTAASITSTFFIAAGTFGAMAFIGATTKMDLTKIGSVLIMALIGLVIASIVNWFMASSTLQYIISYAGVVIFAGLTAYDTQRLLNLGAQMDMDNESAGKAAIMGALSLYLDFINLFLFLLQVLGSKRE